MLLWTNKDQSAEERASLARGASRFATRAVNLFFDNIALSVVSLWMVVLVANQHWQTAQLLALLFIGAGIWRQHDE